MVILNKDIMARVPGCTCFVYDDNRVKHITGYEDCKKDPSFYYVYILTTSVGTVPFYALWDGTHLVSTNTTFEDAKRNVRLVSKFAISNSPKYNGRIKNWSKKNKNL